MIKTIQVYYSRPEAVVAKSALDARGIFAVLPDDYHTANAWHMTFALQGIRLYVLETEERAALEVLEPEPDYKEPEYEVTIASVIIAVLCFFLGGVPYPVLQRRKARPDA